MTRTAPGWPTVIKRNYACIYCGKLRRAPADYLTCAPPPPQCCGKPMRRLSYEQTVAATRLTEVRRAAWLTAGGGVTKAKGRRGWKATK